MMGILNFPGVTVPSRWLLGKILCIEDSGGSSALVFTQSTRARPVITKWRCQIIEAGWGLKLRTTAYSPFPLWVWEAKSFWFDLIWEGSQSIVGTQGVRWAQWPTGSQPSLWLSHFLCSQCASRQKRHYCSWILRQWILASETAQDKLDGLWPVMERVEWIHDE